MDRTADEEIFFDDDGRQTIAAEYTDVEHVADAIADTRSGTVFEEVHGFAAIIIAIDLVVVRLNWVSFQVLP